MEDQHLPLFGPLFPVFDPVEHARTTDPDTSHEAAAATETSEVRRRVFAIFREHAEGLTDEELLAFYARTFPEGSSLESRSSPRKRRSDLARAGLLVDSGMRRTLTSGRRGVVWAIPAARVSA